MDDQAASLRTRLMGTNRTVQRDDTTNKIPHSIAIVSGKGGVGKSNISCNFSILYAKHGARTLLIDLDVGMGNIDVLLGQRSSGSLYDFFTRGVPLKSLIQKGPEGMEYISGGSGFHQLVDLSSARVSAFLDELEAIQAQYDTFILDLGAGISQSHLTFMLAARDIVVVTTPEPTAMTDAYSVLKYLLVHYPEKQPKLLVNKAKNEKEARNVYSRLVGTLHQFLGASVVLYGVLPEDAAVSSAVIQQSPYTVSKPKAAISLAQENIVREQLHMLNGISNEQERSFVQKLRTFLSGRM